jgi:hypothetical protein
MLALTLIKLSILFQYLRFCVMPVERWVCWAMIVFLIAYGIEAVLTNTFVCWPIEFFWTRKGGQCMDRYSMYFANSLLSILSDIAVLLFPAILLRHLRLPLAHKFAIAIILAFGGL